MCLRTFLPALSITYRRELERLRCTSAAIRGGAEELTWKMMIDDARARSNALTVVPEHGPSTIAGFDPPIEVLPAVGTAALATPSSISMKEATAGLSTHTHSALDLGCLQANTSHKCPNCVAVGRSNVASHALEDCFINPQSTNFKEGLHKLRVNELLKKGKEIPETMKRPGENKQSSQPDGAINTDEKLDKSLLSYVGDDLQALLS